MQRLCFPLRNEVIPIPGLRRALKNFSLDVLMNKYYRVLKAFVSFPPLAWSENDKTHDRWESDSGRRLNPALDNCNGNYYRKNYGTSFEVVIDFFFKARTA